MNLRVLGLAMVECKGTETINLPRKISLFLLAAEI